MARVTITIPNTDWTFNSSIGLWQPSAGSYIDLGTSLSSDGTTNIFLALLALPRGTRPNCNLQTAASQSAQPHIMGPEFSSRMESFGTITLTAMNGDSITIAMSDMDEPYSWIPSNLTAVRAFTDTLAGLSNNSLTAVFDDNPVSDTVAPTVTINSISEGTEGTTVQLGATLSGGTYDNLDYQWTATGGTFDDATSATPTWTRPAVSRDTDYTIGLRLTARGTGTNAVNNSSDVSGSSIIARVKNRGNAVAPSVTINEIESGEERTTVQLGATPTGGTYDELDYEWTVSGGTLDNNAIATPTWTRPSVDSDTEFTISLRLTAKGTGTNAVNNSSDVVSVRRGATVTNAPPPERLVHTFQIRTGGNSGTAGLNTTFGRVLSGSATFTTPEGNERTVVMCRRLRTQALVFTLSDQNVPISDFPTRIISKRTGQTDVVTLRPESVRNISAGTRGDYTIESGDISVMYTPNQADITVELYYQDPRIAHTGVLQSSDWSFVTPEITGSRNRTARLRSINWNFITSEVVGKKHTTGFLNTASFSFTSPNVIGRRNRTSVLSPSLWNFTSPNITGKRISITSADWQFITSEVVGKKHTKGSLNAVDWNFVTSEVIGKKHTTGFLNAADFSFTSPSITGKRNRTSTLSLASWLFSSPNITGKRNRSSTLSPSLWNFTSAEIVGKKHTTGFLNAVNWNFVTVEIRGKKHTTGFLNAVDWQFDIPNVLGSKKKEYQGILQPSVWQIVTPNVEGRIPVEYIGVLQASGWQFTSPEITGEKTVSRFIILNPITWNFVTPNITGIIADKVVKSDGTVLFPIRSPILWTFTSPIIEGKRLIRKPNNYTVGNLAPGNYIARVRGIDGPNESEWAELEFTVR